MPSPGTPSRQKRKEDLADLRRLAEQLPHGPLPPLRALAARWTASLAYAQSIVAIAKSEGWVVSKPGSGLWASDRLPSPTKPPSPLRWNAARLAALLEEELDLGRIGGEVPLPSAKELAASHGVHPMTAARALHLLAARGIVERTGRTWKPASPAIRTPYPHQILCIGARDQEGGLRLGGDLEWEFWREIQSEISRYGIEPVLVPWQERIPAHLTSALGAVFSTRHLPNPSEVVGDVRHWGIPLAVWLELPQVLEGTSRSGSRHVWYHHLAYGADAGECLGKSLAPLGHRKVAWIGPFHKSTWSRNRLRGLADSLGPDVHIHEANGPWLNEWDVQTEVWNDPTVWNRLHLEGIPLTGHVADVARPLMEIVTRDRILAEFEPQLEEALASGSTLWVAASDLVASWCLDWLAPRGIEVPRDLSLTSFDDSRFALQKNLTSLRFDVRSMARAMIRQVLMPSTPARRLTQHHGVTVLRESTSRFGSPPST